MKSSVIDELSIVDAYKDGYSVTSLSKIWHCDSRRISSVLRKHNVKIINHPFKYKFDENFFTSETIESYYFWGFILGDGCITVGSGGEFISLTLNRRDVSILENFCKWTKRDEKSIKFYDKISDYCRLDFHGKFFQNDFSKFGLVKRKTYNPVIPTIPDEFIKPYILGFIDADGSTAFHKKITNNSLKKNGEARKVQFENSIQLVGHPIIMNWIIIKLREMGFKGHINFQTIPGKTDCEWKRIRIQRKQDVIDLVKILEVDKYFSILLKRKWENAYAVI